MNFINNSNVLYSGCSKIERFAKALSVSIEDLIK